MVEKVQIEVEVTSAGTENIDDVDNHLQSLTKTTDSTSKSLVKQDDGMRNWNTSLNKQIPAMQVLNPLLNTFNLGMLASVGAVGLVGAGIGMLAQTLLATSTNVAQVGTSMNTDTIGPMLSYGDLMGKLGDLSKSTGESIESLTAGLAGMSPKITDQTTQWNILTQALQIHQDTGMATKTAVTLLSGALDGSVSVHDKLTGALLQGADAEKQEYQNLDKMSNSLGQTKAAVTNFFGVLADKINGLYNYTDATNAAAAATRDLYGALTTNTAINNAMNPGYQSPAIQTPNTIPGTGNTYGPQLPTSPLPPGFSNSNSSTTIINNNLSGIISGDVIGQFLNQLQDQFKLRSPTG